MEKIKVLFVCLGNICRSPAGEAIFLKIISDKRIQDEFIVDSAGTGSWHIGKKADSRMRFAAKQRGIFIKSTARQINQSDFDKFDFILTMDNSNFKNVLALKNRRSLNGNCKIIKMQSFASRFKIYEEVPDPYFGGDDGFDNVLDILEDSVGGFLKSIHQS